MTIMRVLVDPTGKSIFEEFNMEASAVDFAPLAPQVLMSTPTQPSSVLVLPAGWYGEPHLAPARQLMTLLDGALEVTASDGVQRCFNHGDLVMV